MRRTAAQSSFGRLVICRRGGASFRATFAAEGLTQLGVKDTDNQTGYGHAVRCVCLRSLAILTASGSVWPVVGRQGGTRVPGSLGPKFLCLLAAPSLFAELQHARRPTVRRHVRRQWCRVRGPVCGGSSTGDATTTEPNARDWANGGRTSDQGLRQFQTFCHSSSRGWTAENGVLRGPTLARRPASRARRGIAEPRSKYGDEQCDAKLGLLIKCSTRRSRSCRHKSKPLAFPYVFTGRTHESEPKLSVAQYLAPVSADVSTLSALCVWCSSVSPV